MNWKEYNWLSSKFSEEKKLVSPSTLSFCPILLIVADEKKVCVCVCVSVRERERERARVSVLQMTSKRRKLDKNDFLRKRESKLEAPAEMHFHIIRFL